MKIKPLHLQLASNRPCLVVTKHICFYMRWLDSDDHGIILWALSCLLVWFSVLQLLVSGLDGICNKCYTFIYHLEYLSKLTLRRLLFWKMWNLGPSFNLECHALSALHRYYHWVITSMCSLCVIYRSTNVYFDRYLVISEKFSSIDLKKFIESILIVRFVFCSLSQHLVVSIYSLADETILVERLRPSTTFIMRVRAMSEVGFGDFYSVTVETKNVGKPYSILLGILVAAW